MREFAPREHTSPHEPLPPRERVKRDISRFNIPFRPEEHPALWTALAETGEHFEDALSMTRMIDALWPKLDFRGISREKLMVTMLLHDVGKSGPNESSPRLRTAVKALFSPPDKPFDPFRRENAVTTPKSVQDFITETRLAHPNDISDALREELGIDPTQKSILEFWRDHIDWTYDILMHHRSGIVDEDVARIASSHHILEGRNPARIPVDQKQDERNPFAEKTYPLLVILDKYQAFRDRGGADHTKAINAVRTIIERNKACDPGTTDEYLRILGILEASEDVLTAILTTPREID